LTSVWFIMLKIKNILLVEIFLNIYPFSEPKSNKDNYIKSW
jgi:hypothetical protein